MVEIGFLEMKEVTFKDRSGKEFVGEQYKSLVDPITDLFQGNELKAVDQWIKELKLKAKTATMLKNLAHREKAYLATKYKEPISYHYASELKLHVGVDKQGEKRCVEVRTVNPSTIPRLGKKHGNSRSRATTSKLMSPGTPSPIP